MEFKLISFIRDGLQNFFVRRNPNLIERMNHPCETAQFIAVRRNPLLIGSINNPTEKVQSEVIKNNPG